MITALGTAVRETVSGLGYAGRAFMNILGVAPGLWCRRAPGPGHGSHLLHQALLGIGKARGDFRDGGVVPGLKCGQIHQHSQADVGKAGQLPLMVRSAISVPIP